MRFGECLSLVSGRYVYPGMSAGLSAYRAAMRLFYPVFLIQSQPRPYDTTHFTFIDIIEFIAQVIVDISKADNHHSRWWVLRNESLFLGGAIKAAFESQPRCSSNA
jgi:hypothetical protein